MNGNSAFQCIPRFKTFDDLHALKQLQGILPVLKSHVLLIENHMTRHYQQHRFETHEPPIDYTYSMEEVMAILKAAAHTLDKQTGLSFHSAPMIAHLTLEPSESSLITSHDNNGALPISPIIVWTPWNLRHPNRWCHLSKGFKTEVVRRVLQNHASMRPVHELTL
jgi:hypothetical protein